MRVRVLRRLGSRRRAGPIGFRTETATDAYVRSRRRLHSDWRRVCGLPDRNRTEQQRGQVIADRILDRRRRHLGRGGGPDSHAHGPDRPGARLRRDRAANTVRLTIIDNHFASPGAAGGDRVGLGEVRFLGQKIVPPFPRIELTPPFVDFGSLRGRARPRGQGPDREEFRAEPPAASLRRDGDRPRRIAIPSRDHLPASLRAGGWARCARLRLGRVERVLLRLAACRERRPAASARGHRSGRWHRMRAGAARPAAVLTPSRYLRRRFFSASDLPHPGSVHGADH